MNKVVLALALAVGLAGCAVVPVAPRPVAVVPPPPGYFSFSYRSGHPGYYHPHYYHGHPYGYRRPWGYWR
jgi:hypothetical protein